MTSTVLAPTLGEVGPGAVVSSTGMPRYRPSLVPLRTPRTPRSRRPTSVLRRDRPAVRSCDDRGWLRRRAAVVAVARHLPARPSIPALPSLPAIPSLPRAPKPSRRRLRPRPSPAPSTAATPAPHRHTGPQLPPASPHRPPLPRLHPAPTATPTPPPTATPAPSSDAEPLPRRRPRPRQRPSLRRVRTATPATSSSPTPSLATPAPSASPGPGSSESRGHGLALVDPVGGRSSRSPLPWFCTSCIEDAIRTGGPPVRRTGNWRLEGRQTQERCPRRMRPPRRRPIPGRREPQGPSAGPSMRSGSPLGMARSAESTDSAGILTSPLVARPRTMVYSRGGIRGRGAGFHRE